MSCCLFGLVRLVVIVVVFGCVIFLDWGIGIDCFELYLVDIKKR